ncbi:MAG: long-chain fatty acid--CoA ligase [Caldilineales bacterium]|nr:long-chain fatty acid--CoA ligase [Caldilineales bacterium]
MEDTLPKILLASARKFGSKVALREKEFGIWRTTTWEEFLHRVRSFSLGLISLGLQPGDKIAIIGDNRPEWVIAELAAQAAGAVSMGIYQDSIAHEVQYLADFCDAKFIVAEDQEQVDKVLEVWDRLPKVSRVIYFDPRGMRHYREPFLCYFPEVEAMGQDYGRSHPDLFERNVERTQPGDVAILSTTSGTTGKPKLAMLTHHNLISMGRAMMQVDPMTPDDEYLSFLPLAWIGEQMMAISCGLTVGFTLNFPEEPETVKENLREIGPQVMFSPPRIWENMVSEVQVKIEDSTRLKRAMYDWAMRVGYAMADARFAKQTPSAALRWQYRLADWAVLSPIKDKLGLRRLKRCYTGGAALGPDVFRFFHALGVNLKQIYGQTEISGISVLHRDGDVKFQTVGLPLPGTEIRLADNGEILARSPSVFVGYYNNPEATAETLRDGWLHSGDAGYFDESGHLIVIDRAKDVMTLSDGTRFSPQFIENKLKFSPYIKEAVVFGGDYPFVGAFINIDYANVGKWAEKRQIAYTTYTDLAQKPQVYSVVREHVARTNQDLPPAARIRRFLLLHKELDADDAELTRTRKVRRAAIAERYRELVAALYSGQDSVNVESTITYQDGRTATIRTALRIESL